MLRIEAVPCGGPPALTLARTWQASGAEQQDAVDKANQLIARGHAVFITGDSQQAERIQQLAAALLGRAGVAGLPLAEVLSGLADIVFQADNRRLPEAVEHLRQATQVRTRGALGLDASHPEDMKP